MRQPARFITLIVVVLCASFGISRGDDRADARTHYQAGVKAYAAADYKVAIKEFGAAQQLAPADLNNYNLALCYDKLGDAEPAIRYYKEYLSKVPDAPKRAEIEASIARLDGALKSSAAKKAEEQKKLDDAKKAADDKKAQEDSAKRTPAPPPLPPTSGGAGALTGGVVAPPIPDAVPTGVGSTGTPSTGLTVSTGDSQLDKVSGIDINAVRDQRIGGASSGLPDRAGGPATNSMSGGPQPNGMVNPNGPTTANAANAPIPNGAQDKPVAPTETPLYKKWWFWVVLGVATVVVYEIATTPSNNQTTFNREVNREVLPLNSPGRVDSGGLTLHF